MTTTIVIITKKFSFYEKNKTSSLFETLGIPVCTLFNLSSFEIGRPFFLSLRVDFTLLSQRRNGIFFVILVYARFTSNWLRAESATFPKRSLMKILRPRLENDKSIFCPSFVARRQTLGTFPQISVAGFPYFEF